MLTFSKSSWHGWVHKKIEPRYWFNYSLTRKEPSLIKEKIKAAKDKMCPHITFE